jgi:hypothetical protein
MDKATQTIIDNLHKNTGRLGCDAATFSAT